MQKHGIKKVFNRLVLPVGLVLLIFYAVTHINLKDDTVQLKINRKPAGLVPKVNWLVGWDNDVKKQELIKEFTREYQFNNPRVAINLMFSHNINKNAQAREIVRMIQNNIYEWDIFWIDETVYYLVSNLLGDFDWGKKYLLDFQNIEGVKQSQRSEILSNTTILQKTDSVLLGPYIEGFYGVIWYNKKVAQMLNLEIKEQDMNFNDLLKYAQAIKLYNDQNEKQLALFSESTDYFSLSLLFQHLVSSQMENYKSTAPPAVNDSLGILKETVGLFGQLTQYSPLNEAHNVNLWQDAKRLFVDGGTLFMVGKTSLYNEFSQMDSITLSNILPAELPSVKGNRKYIGSFQPSFAIFKSAPNRELAVQLTQAMSTPEFAEKWTSKTRNPTGIAVNLKENYLNSDPVNKFLIYIAKKYQYNVRYFLDAAYLLGSEDSHKYYLVDENLRQLLSGRISEQEMIDNIQKNVTE